MSESELEHFRDLLAKVYLESKDSRFGISPELYSAIGQTLGVPTKTMVKIQHIMQPAAWYQRIWWKIAGRCPSCGQSRWMSRHFIEGWIRRCVHCGFWFE